MRAYPLIGLFNLADPGRIVWLDVLYGILVGLVVPLAIFRALV